MPRVIKIERPGTGDLGRTLAFGGRMAGASSMSFHAMNRNKESITADLKDPADLAMVRDLVATADVMIQNFRPGVMERIGLDHESVAKINPKIIYGSVSGYGDAGPFKDRPGQDLLAQAISGLPWLNGSREDPPVPVGLSVADHLASCHLAQGITALLVRRYRTGRGGLVQTSLFEALLDLQFELLTTRLNDPTVAVQRKGPRSAHAFLPAPYGIYPCSDGYLAIAMNPVPTIGRLLGLHELTSMTRPERLVGAAGGDRGADRRPPADRHRATRGSRVLDAEDVWCAPVLTLEELIAHEGFAAIAMTQQISADDLTLTTTRSPIRVDGHRADERAARPGAWASTTR